MTRSEPDVLGSCTFFSAFATDRKPSPDFGFELRFRPSGNQCLAVFRKIWDGVMHLGICRWENSGGGDILLRKYLNSVGKNRYSIERAPYLVRLRPLFCSVLIVPNTSLHISCSHQPRLAKRLLRGTNWNQM